MVVFYNFGENLYINDESKILNSLINITPSSFVNNSVNKFTLIITDDEFKIFKSKCVLHDFMVREIHLQYSENIITVHKYIKSETKNKTEYLTYLFTFFHNIPNYGLIHRLVSVDDEFIFKDLLKIFRLICVAS